MVTPMLPLSLALGALLLAPAEPAPASAEPSPQPQPAEVPAPTLPASELPAPTVPEPSGARPASVEATQPSPQPSGPSQPEPEPDPGESMLRGRGDLPYGATAGRKSANLRGNQVLVRPFDEPVFSASAVARFDVLLAGGRDVVQPYGFGFAAQLRAHFVQVYKSRFGLELHAGHNRFPQRQNFTLDDEFGTSISRTKLLSTTDVSLGPSLEIPIGPIFLQFGGGVGVGVSSLQRPRSADPIEDELVSAVNVLLRGGLQLGIPVYGNHGLNLGADVQHVFSQREVDIVLDLPEGEQTRPFATTLEAFGGYTMWF